MLIREKRTIIARGSRSTSDWRQRRCCLQLTDAITSSLQSMMETQVLHRLGNGLPRQHFQDQISVQRIRFKDLYPTLLDFNDAFFTEFGECSADGFELHAKIAPDFFACHA